MFANSADRARFQGVFHLQGADMDTVYGLTLEARGRTQAAHQPEGDGHGGVSDARRRAAGHDRGNQAISEGGPAQTGRGAFASPETPS